MKKLSLIIACVGLISTATFATGHKNVFTLKQGVKKQEAAKQDPAKATKAEAVKQEPAKTTPVAKETKETPAAKETKGTESKSGNTSKETPKTPHRNLRAVPVKHETAGKENNSSSAQKK